MEHVSRLLHQLVLFRSPLHHTRFKSAGAVRDFAVGQMRQNGDELLLIRGGTKGSGLFDSRTTSFRKDLKRGDAENAEKMCGL